MHGTRIATERGLTFYKDLNECVKNVGSIKNIVKETVSCLNARYLLGDKIIF